MKRKIIDKLMNWKQNNRDRLPMLLYGARQVGKTYTMQELGKLCFSNTVYVNFEQDERIRAYFSGNLSPEVLIPLLEKYYHTNIVADETLMIFDEIQMCEGALISLKYFAEFAPEFHLIAAGSLLGVAIKRNHYSFPVGKVQMLTVFPDSLHREAMLEYYEYLIVRGMPAAVRAYISPNATLKQEEIRQMILNSYIADMAKYAGNNENIKILGAYESLPMQLAKDNKKFQYKLIKLGARASQYGDSIDWLIQAGIVYRCMKCEQGYMPPNAFQDLTSFKLYYSDVGLLSYKTYITLENILSEESDHFRGILTENYVACALKSNGYDLQYWESDGNAEVDFLIVKDSHLIPVECKSALHVKSKSMMVYRDKYKPQYCIRVSGRNFGFTDGIKSVPLYAVFCI